MAFENRQPSCGEQFRATRAWNTIVSAVRAELPLGRHRKGLKAFTNCFLGNDAVSWTLDYLQRNREALFHPQRTETPITREKVTLLLQKFVEQKIIEDVRGRGQEFKDSSHHLYTFRRESVLPLATYRLATAASRDKGYARKTRSGSLTHVRPSDLPTLTTTATGLQSRRGHLVAAGATRRYRSCSVPR